MDRVKRSFDRLSQKTLALAHRSADRHLRLAVTGLAGAGKTAFITGLVNQLLNAGKANQSSGLPLWQVCREGRLLGVKRGVQPDLDVASFDYQGAMSTLEQATWPESTRNISEIRLVIKYRPQKGIFAKLSDSATLYLDIVDYPGEWLLDLPMLGQSFVHWCQSQQDRMALFASSPHYQAFAQAAGDLNLEAEADEQSLKRVAGLYQILLSDLVHRQGYYLAQPGRMLLPGDLLDTPLLMFFPLLSTQGEPVDEAQFQQWEKTSSKSGYQELKRRYQEYVTQVVKPFYRDYFAGFDRQLVLVDCFTALNRGKAQFDDMASAINGIMESFQFGRSGLLRRLFSPRIDKLLFAASKVDHVTRDQQGNVLLLLNDVLHKSQHFAQFEGCEVETMAISAVKATRHCMVRVDGGEMEVVQGTDNASRKMVTLYPGEVPKHMPETAFWQRQGFDFVNFAPPQFTTEVGKRRFEHIRLDHLLQYLLGDKLD
jgi:uncharacterized protein